MGLGQFQKAIHKYVKQSIDLFLWQSSHQAPHDPLREKWTDSQGASLQSAHHLDWLHGTLSMPELHFSQLRLENNRLLLSAHG